MLMKNTRFRTGLDKVSTTYNKTARQVFVINSVCACTEPDGTGIGVVHVERGGQT